MQGQQMDVSQLVQVTAQAAQAASRAAEALQKIADKKDGSKFNEAGKVVSKPEPYGTDDIEQDISKWTEFYDGFRAWLLYADPEYETSLDHLESNTATPVDISTMDGPQVSRARQLYSILIGSLKGKPLRILKGVSNRNGFEAWRQLLAQYQPRTRARSISLLSALMNFPVFNKSQTILEQVQGFERLRAEYRKSSGVDLADDVSLSILVRCLPKHLQQHMQLQLTESSTYGSIRSLVIAYEQTTSSWTDKRIYSEVGVFTGAVTSYGNPGDLAPMEIGALHWKGKGKGKSKDSQFGWKGKGKGKDDFKGKGKSKGKFGKSDGKGKGFGKKGQTTNQAVYCHYCGKQGHMKKDCFKFQRDQGNGKGGKGSSSVRQVEEIPEGSVADNSASANSSASRPAANGGGKPAVRMVSFFDECDHEFDLTSHCSQGGSIRMIRDGNNACCDVSMSACKTGCKHCHHVYCEEFDISSTDFDDDWTEAPWLYDISANHVRMVADDSLGMDDIVLDSGADVSALPMSFASVGTACAHDGSLFVDAQGNPLEVDFTRLARVRLGDVVFKEKFIVSGVTTPLLSLGNVLRGGWSIHNDGDSQWLTKDEFWIPLFLKRNSLCAKGCIQLIQDIQSTPVDESPQAVRAIHLSEPLQTTWSATC